MLSLKVPSNPQIISQSCLISKHLGTFVYPALSDFWMNPDGVSEHTSQDFNPWKYAQTYFTAQHAVYSGKCFRCPWKSVFYSLNAVSIYIK